MQSEVSGISQGSQRVMISCWSSQGLDEVQGNGSIVLEILGDGQGESQGSGRRLSLDQMGISAS